jgi:N-acylneuraminate cytidylyltransferase
MRVLGIIPARGGSKGVPKKNIKLLKGKPLISYTIEAALKTSFLTNIVVSSDDEDILSLIKTDKNVIAIKRPNKLATDESPTVLTVIHAIEFLKEKGFEYDAVCLLQPTNPLRTSRFIDEAIQKFKVANSDSLVSVLKVPHEYNPHWVFEKNELGNLKISTGEKEIITRRQNLPEAFIRDGAIYLTKIEVLLNQNSLYGNSIAYTESNAEAHINIDTQEDWAKAELLLKKNKL